MPNTISLIGMPGAGKSTVGVLLAKLAGMQFRDSDIDIQIRTGATLQEFLEREGHMKLREVEEQVLMDIEVNQTVLATGGSVVYSPSIMKRLLEAGPVVYIEVDRDVLERRIGAAPPRGIASDTSQSFKEIFEERTPLYKKYASLTVRGTGTSAEALAERILALCTS